MAKKVILGTDIARDAFKVKVNDNFTELYNKDASLEGQINNLGTKVNGATSSATANTIVLRSADGRAKVARPKYIGDILNVLDYVPGSYTTGQTEVSNIDLMYSEDWMVYIRIAVSAELYKAALYFISKVASTSRYIITPIKDDADIEVTVTEEKVNITNISGANRGIDLRIISLGIGGAQS